jgi:O-methyltransferase
MINIQKILHFNNKKLDPSIVNTDQIKNIVLYLANTLDNKLEGDVVELGCYVGETSKYIAKTIQESGCDKKYFVYDSFEGLPDLSKFEENTGWKPRTLNTTEEIFTSNFEINDVPLPTITKSWFKDIDDSQLPDKVCFAFLDGDFYTSIYESLEKVYDRVVDGGYILVHDYKRPDLPGVEAAILEYFRINKLELHIIEACEQLAVIRKNKKPEKMSAPKSRYTIVTGLWDIGRDKLKEGWSRGYSHYLEKFEELLKSDFNMIIFGDENLEQFVKERRSDYNTQFVLRDVNWIKNMPFFDKIQEIRNDPEWFTQAGWLADSTQAKLELYNPLVMSKVFLLHDAKILDKFDSEFMFWLDAGITNTVHYGYFTHDKVLNKLPDVLDKFLFVSFPYPDGGEVHGFTRSKMNEFAQTENVEYVCRAGFFGGPKTMISEINSIYYGLLNNTLSEGYMGTEESIFTLMTYLYPQLFTRFTIEGNGLLGKFFEDLKNLKVEEKNKNIDTRVLSGVSLYVITFNSPKQFAILCDSYLKHPGFIKDTKNYLLDNSTDASTFKEYAKLCEKYNFTHIKKDNLGICGGRQFIAEHFDQSDSKYCIFLEDDMTLCAKNTPSCKNGFSRYTDNLFYKIIKIMDKEKFDFLKFSFSEFFGDNSIQWAWYNVPQVVRERFWPNNKKLPQMGLDPNAPRTEFKNINILEGLGYITGDIYYCNWPQIISKQGNKTMFINTKWASPFEQTWMSFMYQLTKEGELNGALLLLSPIEHNRFDHYPSKLRREN